MSVPDIGPIITEVNTVLQKRLNKMLEEFRDKQEDDLETAKILSDLPLIRKLRHRLQEQTRGRVHFESRVAGLERSLRLVMERNTTLLKQNIELKSQVRDYERNRVNLEITEMSEDEDAGLDLQQRTRSIRELLDSQLSTHLYGQSSDNSKEDSGEEVGRNDPDTSLPWTAKASGSGSGSGSGSDCDSDCGSGSDGGSSSGDAEEAGGVDVDDSDSKTAQVGDHQGEGCGASVETDSSSLANEESEESIEVEEISINGTTYYTNNKRNGTIYECLLDGEIGDEIGYLKDGDVFFS